jgi:hypothetical protein
MYRLSKKGLKMEMLMIKTLKKISLAISAPLLLCAEQKPLNQEPAPLPMHFISNIEFLWWQPSDAALEWANVVEKENVTGVAAASSGQPTMRKKFQHLDYSPGARVELGYQRDCWDMRVNWVWYYNKTTSHLHAEPDSALSTNTGLAGTENGQGIYAPWLGKWLPMSISTSISEVPVQLVYPGPFGQARVSSRLHYDTVDTEAGYSYKTTLNLLRFLFGIRGATINRHAKAHYSDYANLGSLLTQVPTINGFTSGTYSSKLNFWGVGPRIGLYDELSWARSGMRFFGQVSTALLYGPMHARDKTSLFDLAFGSPTLFGGAINHAPRKWLAVSTVQTLLGLGWHRQFKSVDFGINLAWEANMWFMPSQRTTHYPSEANLTVNGLSATLAFTY